MNVSGRSAFTGTVRANINQTAQQKQRRSNSFETNMTADQNGKKVGELKMSVSDSRKTAAVSSVSNYAGNELKGVGSKLMNEAEELARGYGATKMETELTAPDAQGFYRKLGYVPNPDMLKMLRDATAEDSNTSKNAEDLEKKVPIWEKKL